MAYKDKDLVKGQNMKQGILSSTCLRAHANVQNKCYYLCDVEKKESAGKWWNNCITNKHNANTYTLKPNKLKILKSFVETDYVKVFKQLEEIVGLTWVNTFSVRLLNTLSCV